jgi:hypothetical protein
MVAARLATIAAMSAAGALAYKGTLPVEKIFSGDRSERQLTPAELIERTRTSTAASELMGIPADFECAWRGLAYQYAQMLQVRPLKCALQVRLRSIAPAPLHCSLFISSLFAGSIVPSANGKC